MNSAPLRRRRPRAAFLYLFAASTVACVPTGRLDVPPAPPVMPAATAEWPETRAVAHEAAARGEYGRADSALRSFADRHRSSPEGAEARYWRAVLLLDPANPEASPGDAVTALDEYLAPGASQPDYVTAGVLRRLALQADSLRKAVPPPERVSTGVPRDTLRARDEEIKRLETELQQTSEELERLRRRLAPPRPRRP